MVGISPIWIDGKSLRLIEIGTNWPSFPHYSDLWDPDLKESHGLQHVHHDEEIYAHVEKIRVREVDQFDHGQTLFSRSLESWLDCGESFTGINGINSS